MKRVFDIIVSIIVIILLGWLVLILILISAIVHKSKGVFLQTRIGKDQKEFKIYKIQSMKVTTGNGNTVTLMLDPRVTKYGIFIRKFKLDEIPQIINVLNGTMSIVGPRPTVKEDALKMDKNQCARFNVLPGLTGLAQINGNTSINWPKRIEYDIEYINNQSFLLDIKIIMKTISLILKNKAETHPKHDNEWE